MEVPVETFSQLLCVSPFLKTRPPYRDVTDPKTAKQGVTGVRWGCIKKKFPDNFTPSVHCWTPKEHFQTLKTFFECELQKFKTPKRVSR
jgi:hypothetical protein